MEARLVTYHELPHVTRGIRMDRVILPLGKLQVFHEKLIQFIDKGLFASKQVNEIREVMAHVPDIGPRVVLVVVSPGTDTSREDIVEGLDKLTVFIFRVKETGLAIPKISVVER